MKGKLVALAGVILLLTVFSSSTFALEYDGVWFLGMNMHKSLFTGEKGKLVRQAFTMAINKEKIVYNIMSAEVVPGGPIPPGMPGCDSSLKPYPPDLKAAKSLMNRAGYPVTDKRIKNLTLLHTDGIKTIEIAKQILNDLKRIGVKISLVQFKYEDQDKWVAALESGEYDLFLMGYKADDPEDTTTLLAPLFSSRGEANVSYYWNDRVDSLISQVKAMDPSMKKEREEKLKEIDRIIYEDAPTVNLFYITRL